MAIEELYILKVTNPLLPVYIAKVVYAITLTQLVDLTNMSWFIN